MNDKYLNNIPTSFGKDILNESIRVWVGFFLTQVDRVLDFNTVTQQIFYFMHIYIYQFLRTSVYCV